MGDGADCKSARGIDLNTNGRLKIGVGFTVRVKVMDRFRNRVRRRMK